MSAKTRIKSLGNAGFQVEHGEVRLVLDPLWGMLPGLAAPARLDLILITHDHWDHLDASEVASVAERTRAAVIGSRPVARKLRGLMPDELVIELEPPKCGDSLRRRVAEVDVTAFRTFHGQAHNSYLVELPGFRFVHDGDNEKTEFLDRAALRDLDALMLCPWQGSGWVEFIEAVKPRCWFLMHMSEDELDQHERGGFFPEICDHVPMAPVALHPGESHVIGDELGEAEA